MSRSFKKTPIVGITTAQSGKEDKRKANRLFRRLTRISTKQKKEAPGSIREVSNTWKFGKDGKRYVLGSKRIRK